jgi:methyltransferase (TIGR00027 family)
MQETFSRTALRVAMRRAAHQILDWPLVLEDPYAFRILPPEAAADVRTAAAGEQHHFAKAMRAFMAVRSRFAEDEFARAVAAGVRQYVALGAGLDTFAWRNPHRECGVRVFEVDHPATQAWKRGLMEQGSLPEPLATVYVPVDFERESLASRLGEAGFDAGEPAFFSWLGVVPYLTLDAFRGTLRFFGAMATGSGVVFDYALPREALGESERRVLDELSARVAKVGEPFQLFFTPAQLSEELRSVGWRVLADLGGAEIRSRYFPGREEIRGGLGRLMSAGN